MPLIPPTTPKDEASKEVYEQLTEAYPQFTNLYGTLAHSPTVLQHIGGFMHNQNNLDIPAKLQELAVVTTAHLHGCTFCVTQHSPRAEQAGYSQEQIKHVLSLKLTDNPTISASDLFDNTENTVLALCYHLAWGEIKGRDKPGELHIARTKMHESLKSVFSNRQIEELIWRIKICNAFNTHNEFLDLHV